MKLFLFIKQKKILVIQKRKLNQVS